MVIDHKGNTTKFNTSKGVLDFYDDSFSNRCPDLTDAESKLIREVYRKANNNEKITEKCPRCGGKIIYEEIGNSSELRCENRCIFRVYRGL